MAEQWMPGAVREPQPGGVTLNTSLPPRATWHITWDAVTNGAQPPMGNVSSYLKRQGYCPHLMWNPFTGEIIQYYPASVGGRALNAWNQDGAVNIQIEVYFSPGVNNAGRAYQTVADTPARGWAEILAWLDTHGIPRVWPLGAPQWQGNSRSADVWNTRAGHYGHCNVPDNTHTDPGPMPSLTTPSGLSTDITPIQEDDMPITDEDAKKIAAAVVGYQVPRTGGGTNTLAWSLGAEAQRTEGIIARTAEAAARAVLTTLIPRGGTAVGGHTTLAAMAAYFDQSRADIISGQSPVTVPGLDQDAINAAISAGVQAALKDTTATITLGGTK